MHGIEELRSALEALEVDVEDVATQFSLVALESYPDGPRPSTTVTLHGRGEHGHGEHVGWTEAEHAAFRDRAAAVPRGRRRLGEWVARLAGLPPYDRAALEAAAIDLALRQRGTNLFAMTRLPPRPARYVVSFTRVTDPVAHAQSLAHEDIEIKIDADPSWPDATWRALAGLGCVAVVDFKLDGSADDHERAHSHLPDAWIEDPRPGTPMWSPSLLSRVSADAPVTSVAALDAIVPRPAAVNVKPARMGGVLEAISCLARCKQQRMTGYVGGMFEVGVGRSQSLALAALATSDGPNDIAPLFGELPFPPRLVARVDEPGFGTTVAG